MPCPFPDQLELPPFPKDRYQVLGLLGQGGMGKVYQGRDRQLGRRVALKFLRGNDPVLAANLLREAQCQAGFEHPNIRKIHEVGCLDGLPCIAMEYIHGRDLHAKAPELSLTQAAALVAQAAWAAHAAHQHGLVHRDLKPRNILVEEGGHGELRAVLTDFGLARPMEPGSLSFTQGLAGTPFFIAPEQITGGAPVNALCDVYALGATLYAVCTGTPPFAPNGATEPGPALAADSSSPILARTTDPEPHALEALRRVLDEDPAPPRTLRPELARDLETIILKCLEKDPGRRYGSARMLAEELERFLRGEAILARPCGPWARLGKGWRRHRSRYGALAASLLVLASLGAWQAQGLRRTRRQAELAQRFGAEALQLAQVLRLTSMSPLHDRRGQMAWLAQRVAEIKAQTEALGPVAAAPGAYAQGQGYLALEQPEKALECLNTAWELGLTLPQVTFARGEAYLSLYQKGMEKIATSSPVIAQARRNQLLTRYRDPALACFSRALGPEGLDPYRRTVLAHLQGDDLETIAQARRTLQETPWMFEVLRLEAQAWAHRAQLARDPGQRAQALDRAQACWTDLTARAPSHPALWAGRANLELARAEQALQDRLPGAERALAQAQESCRKSRLSDPSHVAGFLTEAALHQLRSRLMGSRDFQLGEPEADRAEQALAEARNLYPQDPEVLQALAEAQLFRADLAHLLHEATRPRLDRVQATLAQALRVAPMDPGLWAMRVGLDAAEATEQEARGEDSRALRRQALAEVETYLRTFGGTRLLERVHQESRLRLANSCVLQGDPAEATPLVESCLQRLALLVAQDPTLADFQDLAGTAATLRLTCAALASEEPAAVAAQLRWRLDGFRRQCGGTFQLDLNRARLDLFEARSQEALGRDPSARLDRARDALLGLAKNHPGAELPFGNLAHVALVALRYRLRQGQDPSGACREALAWSHRALKAHKQHGAALAIQGAALAVQAERAPGPRQAALRRAARACLTLGLRADPSLRSDLAPFLQKLGASRRAL